MILRLKRTIVLLLILVVQIQPLQVHAIVLDSEQSGHLPGQLSHAHHGHHTSPHPQNLEQHGGTSGTVHHSQETVHAGECHPAHTLCTMIVFRSELERNHTAVQVHPASVLPFFKPSLELPPPKFFS